jgi:D-serine deaminase-like pyridoxal phosphate-dependent protein
MEPEDREFMRQLLEQHGKAIDAMIKRLDEGTERNRAETQQIRKQIEDSRARTEETRAGGYSPEGIRAHTREFVAQMRKERKAFLRRLERFGGQGA